MAPTTLNRLDLRGVTGDLRPHLPRPDAGGDEPVAVVRAILDDVRDRGDAAVREYTERFDGVVLGDLRVPAAALADALDAADPALVASLRAAHDAIEDFHRTQVRAEHRGGRGAYPSTVLMTAVPAKVAGVGETVLCVPPDRRTGAVAPAVLAAAALAGVDEVYAIGGAQAVAAMAFGTESVRAVDVISGPGNIYVAIAKREVSGTVGIPSAFAGPSEIVVIADETTPVDYAAIDVIVQAEHGPNGLAWLITWSEPAADAIDDAIAKMVAASPRQAEILSTFASGGYAVLVDSPERAIEVANLIAPEHLQLMNADPEALVPQVRHAGAVFTGPLAPASIGDYIAGPSHVLPTDGTARFGSALTVDDFVKQVHVISLDPAAFAAVAPHVETLARVEGFDAHAESVRLRLADQRATGTGTGQGPS
jgi:histidinol dehydrogenase